MSTPSSAVASASELPAGSVVAGRYQIEALIGRGGMGDVYLVRHTVMRKRLALKLLRAEISQVPEFAARFEREAMAAANIDHPHVAAATDCGQTPEGTFFLALEYVEGKSLREVIQGGLLPLQRTLHIGQQVASALVRAHELGIVHRDLKPENIMLTSREGDPDFVKVLDFGMAKLSSEPTPGDQHATVQKLTQYGEIFGTPQYMAPEQTTGEDADGRTDLYALGMVLYELLTGRLPFDGKDVADFLRHQLATPLPPFRQRAPQVTVPVGIEALVRRLCAKHPEDRFQSAEQFLEALEAAADSNHLVLAPARSRHSSPSVHDKPSGPVAISGPRGTPLAPVAAQPPKSAAVAPGAPALLPNTASMVMFLGAVGRVQQRMPKPLQKVSPEKLALLVAVLGLGLFAGGVLVIRSLRFSPDGKPPAAEANRPTAEEVQTAATAGPASLQQLVERYPNAVEPLRALATAYIQKGPVDSALTALGKLARKDPQALDEPAVSQFLSAQLMSNQEETAAAALRVLERDFADRGVDLLIQLADRAPPRLRPRFHASLSNMRAHTDLSPATQALLDLRMATKCDQKRAALARVRESGDGRSLAGLNALQARKGCAPYGLGDCWQCLRQTTEIEEAIKAVTSRAGGK